MGRKDSISKKYMSDNVRFADAFNYFLYNGQEVIKPEDLEDRDPTEIGIIPNLGKAEYTAQKVRDVFKTAVVKRTKDVVYVLLGIENQSDVHYAMPVRNMLYDSLDYAGQVEDLKKTNRKNRDGADFLSGLKAEDRLVPVVTLVVYFGAEEWDAPRALHKMFDKGKYGHILRFVPDYRINLIAPIECTDFSRFRSELGMLIEFIAFSKDKEKMAQLAENRKYERVSAESVVMVNEFTGAGIRVDETEKEVNMCEAIKGLVEDGRAEGKVEGRAEGRVEGRAEGKLLGLYELVRDGDITPRRGAEKAGKTIEEFVAGMKEAGYSLPE